MNTRRHHAQRDVAVDPARFQVVDGGGASRRTLRGHRLPGRVEHDGDDVVGRGERVGQFDAEREVAASVRGELFSVAGHGRGHHGGVEVEEYSGVGRSRTGQVPSVDPDPLPGRGIPVPPGQVHHRMRQVTGVKRASSKSGSVAPGTLSAKRQPVFSGYRAPDGPRAGAAAASPQPRAASMPPVSTPARSNALRDMPDLPMTIDLTSATHRRQWCAESDHHPDQPRRVVHRFVHRYTREFSCRGLR